MKKIILSALILAGISTSAQNISNFIFGQNAFLTDSVGTAKLYGKLDQFWDPALPATNYTKEANVKIMRYDGIDIETFCLIHGDTSISSSKLYITAYDYIKKATIMQQNGSVPMLALPLNLSAPLGSPLTNPQDAALQAAMLVRFVNNKLVAKGLQPCRRWIYSNEPTGNIHNYNDSLAAKTIYEYTRYYHDSVVKYWNPSWNDPALPYTKPIFVGPELVDFDNYQHTANAGNNNINKLIDQLLGKYTPYGNFSILPYINVFTFHYYPFSDQNFSGTAPLGGFYVQAKRKNVVDMLRNPVAFAKGPSFLTTPLAANLDYLLTPGTGLIAKHNATVSASQQVTVAITEGNLCYANNVTASGTVTETKDLTNKGTSANGHIAGQFLAEIMSLCMEKKVDLNMWSSIEGDPNDNYKTDIGYLSSNAATLGKKKSSYHHFKLLADNFRGTHYKGGYNQNSVSSPAPTFTNGIKTFCSVEPAGAKIIIMNQNDSVCYYPFRINFNGSAATSAGKINLVYNINTDPAVASTWTTTQYPNPLASPAQTVLPIPGRTTILLTFDCHGDLFSREEYSEWDAQGPHMRQIKGAMINPDIFVCGKASSIGGSVNTSTTFINDTVYINNSVLLAGNTKLTFINSVVIMAPNTKISTTPQATLEIIGSALVGCGNQTWQGLEINSNNQTGLKLLIQNSVIYNAITPVKATKLASMNISQSIFANGNTAIKLDRAQEFNITENIFVGFKTGISTDATQKNYVSRITDNQFIGMETAMQFVKDEHNMLDVFCNEIRYKQEGIKSTATNLKDQGTTAVSASNVFIKTTSGVPVDYIDHSGSATKYYYGPSDVPAFSFPNISNIPIIQAGADRVCKQTFTVACPSWINPVGIKENINVPSAGFLVYPNPSSGAFSIKLGEEVQGNYVLNIHDVLGRLISTEKVNVSADKILTFEIQARGLYFVSLQGKEKFITQKVIVE